MTPEYIVNVTEANFEFEVIAYSRNVPVVVDFWAAWCKPCKELGYYLEKFAREAAGAFRLARVNVDENPNLAFRYAVRSIPVVKAFSGGEVVAEITGAQPENRLREFLSRIQPPSPASLAVEHGESLLTSEEWQQAETVFRDALAQVPDDPAGLLGLTRALLAQGKSHEAHSIVTSFPASRQYARAETLRAFSKALIDLPGHLADTGEDESSAAYWNAVRLASRGRIQIALDGLLDILRQNRSDQRARLLVLSLLELLGEDNPQTRDYRKELSSILF